MSAWIRPTAFPENGARIIDKIPAGIDEGFLLDTHPNNALRLITSYGMVTYDAQLPVDTWSHVAATMDITGNLCLYLNGKQVASVPCKATPTATPPFQKLYAIYTALTNAGLGQCYEARHARLIIDNIASIHKRGQMLEDGLLTPLPAPSQIAADKSYVETTAKLTDGLIKVIESYKDSPDPHKKQVYKLCDQAVHGSVPVGNN